MDREQQSTRPRATRATSPKPRAKAPAKAAKPKQAQSSAKSGQPEAGTSAPDIMSRLPRSRPQRASQRRRGPVPAAGKASQGATAATPKAPARQKRAPAAARRPAPAATGATAARSTSTEGGAPGLPRLAIDGATEVVKLPLKVSGRLTLKALDAVARGLRRR